MDERDMRDMRGMDGRNPYGSRGGYVVSSRGRGRGRGRRGDRGMDYGYDGRVIRSYPNVDMRGQDYGDMNYDMARNQPRTRSGRFRRDYGDDMRHDYERDMRGGDYAMDGHYPQGQGATYYPIQAMGTFEGYYGMPEQDYGRGRRDYGMSDYRGGYGRRDYGYDYGYDDYGDYGETLSVKELEHWNKKLMEQLDEREKQMFSKDAIMQKIKQMNIPMDGFGEKELYTATLAMYTDHKASIGQNPDLAIKLGRDFLTDKDSNVKGAERLCVYYDTFVED